MRRYYYLFIFLIASAFALTPFQNVQSVFAADASIVGQWHMDGNWNDSSGNNYHGAAYNGATFTISSKSGTHAGSFDGVDDYVVTPLVTTLQKFTVEAWVKPSSTAGDLMEIVSKRSYYATAMSDFPFALFIDKTGTRATVFVDSGNDYVADLSVTSPAFSANAFHHIAATYDGITLTIYIDGSGTSVSGNIILSNNTRPYTIGRSSYENSGQVGKTAFNGVIDELAIYNRALSAEEIKAHYDAGSVNLTPPVAVWRMDNNWSDSSGNGNNGTAYNGATFSTNAKSGTHAGSFDGSNDYVESISTSFDLNIMTVEAWVRPTTINIFNDIVSKGSNGASWDYRLALEDASGTNANNVKFHFYVRKDTSTWYSVTATVTGKPNMNTWYHVVGSFDGAVLKIYINGVLEGTSSAAFTPQDTGNYLWVGRWTQGTRYFTGTVDEVSIYNRALSAEEIKAHYDAAASVAKPTVNSVPSTTSSQTITLSGTKSADTAVIVNGTQIVPLDGSTIWSGTYALQAGANTLTVVARNSGGYNSEPVVINVTYTPPGSHSPNEVPGLILWYKADSITGLSDGSAVTTWNDSSNSRNNASLSSAAQKPIYKTNVLNGKPVIRFDGIDDYMAFSSISTIRTAIFVVNNTGNTSYPPLLGHSSSYDWHGDSGDYVFSTYWGSSYITNGSAYENGTSATPGSLLKSSAYKILTFKTTGNVNAQYITRDRGWPDRVWKGDYAEIIIYDRVITDAERKGIEKYLADKYAMPISHGGDNPSLVGLWHMDNNWLDSSGNNKHGTPVNDITFSASGKRGTHAGKFDGVNDSVDIGNWFNYQTFTMEMWVNPGSTQVQYADIIDNNHTDYRGWVLQQTSTNTNQYCYGASYNCAICFNLTPNQWTHITITRDGGSRIITVYINGVPLQSCTGTSDIAYDGTQFVRLGRWGGGGRNWNGLMDDVAVYNRVLSAGEVLTNYQNGVVSQPIVNSVPSTVYSQTITLSGTKPANTSIIVNGTQIVPLDSSTTWQGTYALQAGASMLNIIARNSAGYNSEPVTVNVTYLTPPTAIWHMDNNWQDSSGSNYHGTANNGATFSANSKLGTHAGSFDGANDYISYGNIFSLDGSYTIEAWIKPSAFSNDAAILYNGDGWAFRYNFAVYSNGKLGFSGNSSGGWSGRWIYYSTGVLTLNEWNHVVVKRNGGSGATAYFYINGVESGSFIDNHYAVSAGPLYSGMAYLNYGYYYFKGLIDEVAVYNRALTADEIKAHSNAFQEIIQPTPSEGIDAYIRINDDWDQYKNTINHGSDTALEFRKYGDNSYDRKVFLKFDLSKYANITSAKLYLYFYYIPPEFGSRTLALKKVTSNWDELTITAANQPNMGSTTYATNIVSTNSPGWYSWDITSLAQEWVTNPSNNYGLAMFINETSAGWYNANAYSSDYTGDISLRPKLVLAGTYAPISPPIVNSVPSLTATKIITLSGTKPADTAIVVNGTTITPLDSSTTWQGTYTLSSGSNTLNITAMDAKGYQSAAVTLSVTLDNTAPAISSSTPANNASINTLVTSMTINLTDTYSSIDLSATTTGATVKNSSNQEISGVWTTGSNAVVFTPSNSLSQDTYTVTVYPTDVFGNKTTAQIAFTYDATAPPLPTVNAVSSPTNQSSQALTGTKSTDTTAIIVTSSTATIGAVTYPTSTTWSVSVTNLKAGDNAITITAKDAAGNISNPVLATIAYDVTAPSAPVVNTVASPTKNTSITLGGTKDANSSILINGTTKVTLDGSTEWQTAYTLQSGSNTLSFTSKDAAGNQSSATTITIILDDKPPVIESSAPANNSDTAKVVSSITINLTDTYSAVDLTASAIGATVKNASGQEISGAWTTSGNTSVIFTPSSPFPESTYTVIIYPADALGNKGQQQIIFTNHDITPPVTTIALSGTKDSAGWYSTPVTVTMTATDGADGSGIDKIEYSLDGITWNLYSSPFVLDKDGNNTLYYHAIDKAGNIEASASNKNVALSSNGGVASATSRNKDNNASCDGSAYFANDGQAVQAYAGCGDGGTWLGAKSTGDTWMISFDSPKTISQMRWMAWTWAGWSDPQSQPKNYYVEYTTDSSPIINGGNWLPVPNMAITNSNGTVNQASAYVSGNTNGNWLNDTAHNWIVHDFTPVNATALRIRVASKVSGGTYGPALGEVEVYESQSLKSQIIKINQSGIVGWWKMDSNWQDSSVIGNHGTANNGVTFSASAKVGTYAGGFDGADDYVQIADDVSLDITDKITIEAWVKTNKLTGVQSVISKSSSTSNNGYIFPRWDGDTFGNYVLNIGGGWVHNSILWTTISDPYGWHHVAFTYDGSLMKTYVDGVLKKETPRTGSITTNSNPLVIGNQKGFSEYFNGLLDDVRIYNRVLSSEEIKAHYDAASIPSPTVNPVTSPTGTKIITLSGTKPAETAIVVNGTTISPLDSLTTWQGTYTLNSGSNTLNITAMDSKGYQSASVALTVILDDKAPAISSSTPANNASINTPITSMTISLTDTYSSIDLAATTTGATVKNSSNQEISGVWSTGSNAIIFTPSNSLSEDTYAVTVYPTDVFGNKATAQITFNYDATAPPAPTVNAVSSPTNQSSQTLTGTKSTDTTAIIVTSSTATIGAVTYPTSTTWSVSVTNLKAGDNVITVTARDIAGNISSPATVNILYDITAPFGPAVNPVTSPTKNAVINLSGTKEADTSVWINNIKIQERDNLTTWQYTYTLQSGSNTLNITSKDSAGNQSGATTITVILDDKPPVIESSSPANNSDTAKVISSVTINLTDIYSAIDLAGSTTGATVKNASGLTIPGTWTTSGTKTITFTPSSPFPEDTYTVTVYPADVLGNSGMQQIKFTNHDITPPVTTVTLSGTKDSAGWYSTQVTVTLTAVDDAEGIGIEKIEYSLDNITWNLYSAPFVINKDGTTTVKYRSTDKAGNIETAKSQDIKINQSGIVGWWKMDNNWQDSSIVGNHGTAFNGAAFTSNAKIGTYAGTFDGVNDYVNISKTASLKPVSVSVEAWIKRTTGGVIFGDFYYRPSTQSYGYGLSLEPDNKIYFNLGVAPTFKQAVSANTIPSGTWTHIVGTYDGTDIRIYVNGLLNGIPVSATSDILYATEVIDFDFRIGRDPNPSGASYFKGLIDEVVIYNRALTADEVKAHYDAAQVQPPTVNPVTSPMSTQSITLSGTKQANTSVRVNGTEIVPLDSSTTWQGTYTLSSGSNTLNITAMDAKSYQSASVALTVILDDKAPVIASSTPANNASFNTPVTSVTINLTDTYSTIDLTATTSNATVKNSSGQTISGAWTTSGNNAVIFTPSNQLLSDTYTVTVYPTDGFGNKATAQIAFSYDTTAPPVPAINAVISPTNIGFQVVTGIKTAETASVTVTSTEATIGTVTYPTPTTWSVSVSNLQQGANTITVYAKDAAGNQSSGVSATITYDTAAPSAPTVNALTSPTRNSSVNLSGTKETGTYLYVNGIKTASLYQETAWSYTAGLNEGGNTFSVYVKDEAGNQSQAASVSAIRDTTAPSISSSTPSANAYTTSAGTIDIVLADTYSSVNLQASLTGAVVKDGSGAGIAGSWSVSGNHLIFTPSAPLAGSVYTVILYPADSLGNKGTVSFSFTIDTAPPSVQSLTMNPASPHKAETVTFTITFNKDMTTSVQPVVTFGANFPYNTYQTTGSWTNSKTWQGTYTFTAGTGDGAYKIMVSGAKDKAGNVMAPAEAGDFILDTGTPAKPVLNSITTPTKVAAVTISGTKPANTAITINGAQKVALDSLTTWSVAYTFTEGTNQLTVKAVNAAGNESAAASATVVLDTVAPRIASSAPANGSSLTQVNKVDVLLTDDTTGVDLDASKTGASVKVSGQQVSGLWTVENNHLIFTPTSQMAEGLYTVTLSPADILGNKATTSFNFTIETAPPQVQTLAMSPPSPHKAETVTFTITFNEDMTTGVAPIVTFGTNSPYNTYQLSGAWTNSKTWQGTYAFTANTGDGMYTVKVSGAKDKAGNTFSPQDIGTFVLDTIPPTSPAINTVTTPTKAPNQSISGAKPADTAIVINGIERVSLNSSTTWSYTYPLSEGTNNISAAARDAAGNDSTPVTTAIKLDTTPPAFTIDNYKSPSPSATQTISGTKEPGCLIKLNNTTIIDSTDMNSTWSYALTLTQGISNHFVFTASDALGNTTTKAIDVLYDTAAPSQLGPGILVADGKGKGAEITLSWSAYVETPDIAYYRIFMSQTNFTDTTSMTPLGTTNKGVKTFKVTGLTQGATYYFGVVPIDVSGNYNSQVNSASGIPADTASPEEATVTSVTAGYEAVSGNYITIKWNPSANSRGDLADQIIYFDDGKGYDAGTSLGKIVTVYTKTGLLDATKYKFKITVKDTPGHESTGVITEGVTRLGNPSTLTAASGNAKITLSWSAVSSPYVKQYNLYRLISDVQQKDIKTMLLIKTVSVNSVSYTDTGLTNGTDYQYAVATVNTFGAERTDVSSITARPRSDATGPVISGLNIVQSQVITAPITITASAADAESSMAKIELYIDGSLVKSQPGSSISWFWNVVDTTDGNHTVKLIAYDQYGNMTEDSRQVVVSLAPPATPSITGHTIVQTSPKYLVNVSGTAARFTTVILKVNDSVVTQAPASDTGAFTFTSVELKEGDNLLSVKATHRGGESQYSPDYKIVVDTGAPSSPVNLTSQVLTGGVRLSWQNAAGETPSGYNLYMSSSSFTSRTSAGVTKVNAAPILYLFNDYTPPSDSLRYYAVTSVDSAGNESGISNIVSVSSDRVAPSVTGILYSSDSPVYPFTDLPNPTAGTGTIKVKVTVNEPLKELPFFSLEPSSGSPIIISLTKVSDTLYEGSFSVTALIASGQTTYKFAGKDMIGNRGTSQGAGITIDASGPVASIQSPLTVLQIKTEPVTVGITFNEPSVTTPLMELRASNGALSSITNLTTSDNGVHWTGTMDISSLPEGNAEFVLKEAKDKLGNIGTAVSGGKTILIYRDSVPSPDTPSGLTAKTGKGGVITLTWNPIGSASSYNLYRRAQNDTTPLKIKTGMLGSPSQDTPPSDGVYYYSVTSIGLLQSESSKSTEVQGTSDRTGPSAPLNLSLSLDSTGVVATWSNSSSETPWAYALYRSNAPISSASGLTPVIKVGITKAVDVSPSRTYRFYAVAAHDTLGNEGPLSETKEINFPVSPVRDLLVEKIDDAAPLITWLAPYDGDTAGYYIYRNGQKINQFPVTALSYTDGYYSGGNVTYGISAVNNLNVEGPVKEVTLPELSIGIKQGTVLRRGLLETVPVIIGNSPINPFTYSSLTIDAISIKVGTAPSSSLPGPFSLAAGSTLQVEKVASTTADAPSFVSVLVTASWSPAPGAVIRITKTATAEVTGASAAMEIFSDPLVRGTDGKVRLKINNIGTALMEFLTSENSTSTRKLKITLKDEDANVLSTGYLDQRVGSAILNTGSYAVARLNPGENIITDPITLSVPSSAPYKVIIEAAIENTFYHYGKSDQVTAPGMTQSTGTTISDVAYRATASPEKAFYPYAQPVLITGQAISNSTNQPMPNVSVKLGISVKGFDRYATLTTNANGSFTYTFTPGANEAGLYTVWAMHPDLKDRAVQATFAIAGLSITPSYANVRMTRGRSLDISVSLYNYGGASLTGLTLETSAGPGITAGVINSGDNILTSGETQAVTLRLTSSTNAPDTSYATLNVKTAEGINTRLDASVSLVSSIPIITTSPSFIDTGMVRGNQKIATFTLTNAGEETLRNARIEGPSTSWMTLTINRALGDIQPGVSKTIGIMFNPPSTLSQGVYDDRVVIYSDNHIPYTYHIQVTVTSNAVGNVMFDVLNELMQDVPNASITLQHQTLPELIYTLRTTADGTVMLYDIPEGRYSFNISATGHKSYSGTFVISPGITTTVPIALEVTLVQVEWSVTPIVIQDRYEIVITQTFETNVPTPVLVIEPAGITVPELAPGQVFNGEFTVSNYGLIALNNVNVQFPTSFGEYNIELLATVPKTLNAMQKVTVPYKITRRMQTASLDSSLVACLPAGVGRSSLLEEVQGYGGTPCYTSFGITVTGTAIICPGTAQEKTVTKNAGYSISVPIPGSNCSISGGTYSGGYTGGGGGSYGGGVGGQTGGGGTTSSSVSVITPIASETCFFPRCTSGVCQNDTRECTGSSVILANGTYEFSETDLSVPASALPVEWTRSYRSNRILKASGNWTFGEPADGPLGFGWMTEYFAKIENSDTYIDGQGIYTTFAKDSSGNFLTDLENGLILKKTASGYELTEIGGKTYIFNTAGKLTSIKDLRGNSITLIYDSNNRLVSIKDASGRTALTFSYNSSNRISSVTDIANRTVNYEYDSIGNLIRVTQDASRITQYTYNNNHGITTKSNPLNETYVIEYQYADKGIVSKITDPSQKTMSNVYDFKNGIFYVTDYNGSKKKKIINETGKLIQEEQVEGASSKTAKKIEYLENRTERITDATGNTTTLQRDEWRNVIKTIDGEGNETRITYNNNKKPLTITDALGNVTRMEYDQYGNLIKLTQAEGKPEQIITSYVYDNYNQVTSATTGGSTRSIVYNTSGLPTSITDPLGNVTTIQYNASGNAIAIIDPNNNKAEFTYDFDGNMLTSKDPLGNITTHTYNAANRPAKITDALNRITNIETDFRGRVTAITDALNNKKEFQYDGNGNLTKITEGLNITAMTYDASNRLTTITDPDGNKTAYEYAAGATCSSCTGGSADSPIKITDPLGNLTKYIYDKNGKLNSIIDPMGNISLLGRDATGKVITRTDANGKITKYQYDALGRITKQTDANNGETIFAYDARGNLKTLIDPQGNTTTFEYDSADRMIKETRPMGQVIEYAYYPNGLLKTVKDSKGQITTYTYDSANRLKEIVYADGKKDTFTYDALGNMLTYMKDGVSGTLTYDELNRKLSETVNYGSFGKTYSYTYDSLSNKATFTSPEGKVYAYTYNKNSQPTSIVFDNKTIGLTYQVDRLTKAVLPNGVTTDYQYNANSWLNYINTKNASSSYLDKQYEFDKVGNITRKTDNATSITDYTYDPTYQLTKAANPSLTEDFSYDKVGNRLTSSSLRAEGEAISSYTHNANNELSQSCIVNPASCIVYAYDRNGNTIQETNGSGITKFIYNSGDRLERVELPDGRIAIYTYDPFGRRIKKDVAGEITYYLYADEGLIGEYDTNGNLKKAYGWVPDSIWGTDPVFMLENNNYYFYHNDHLGTPQKMTDVNGNVVWSATYTAFGEATVDLSSTVTNNLRFPGQYYDAETGKHYNWNRYFDPKRGRYTQTDPIGFRAGDVNLYRYVWNQANRWIDPLGLDDLSDLDHEGYIPLNWNEWPLYDLKKLTDINGLLKELAEYPFPLPIARLPKAAQGIVCGAKKISKAKKPHGNIADDRPATLYKKVDKDGDLEKWGITQHENPRKRYPKKEIGEGDVIEVERGPRKKMLKKERDLVETQPGPKNREPWAGKRRKQ